MKQLYVVLRPIGHGGRHEKGAEVMLTEAEAANLGSDYVALKGAVEASAAVEVAEKPVEKMTVAELRIKAEALGLETAGSKADLQERISLHLANGDGE